MSTPTVEQARKQLRENMKAAGLDTRRDFWTYCEDHRWWEVQVPALDLCAWVYADNAAHAKNLAARQWFRATT